MFCFLYIPLFCVPCDKVNIVVWQQGKQVTFIHFFVHSFLTNVPHRSLTATEYKSIGSTTLILSRCQPSAPTQVPIRPGRQKKTIKKTTHVLFMATPNVATQMVHSAICYLLIKEKTTSSVIHTVYN